MVITSTAPSSLGNRFCRQWRTCLRGAPAVALTIAPFLSAVAQPQEPQNDAPKRPEFDVSLGVGQTDNLFRDSANLRSDITTLGLNLDGRYLQGMDWC